MVVGTHQPFQICTCLGRGLCQTRHQGSNIFENALINTSHRLKTYFFLSPRETRFPSIIHCPRLRNPSLCHTIYNSRTISSTPCGTRAHNLRIRSPTPCPLGQGGQCSAHADLYALKIGKLVDRAHHEHPRVLRWTDGGCALCPFLAIRIIAEECRRRKYLH